MMWNRPGAFLLVGYLILVPAIVYSVISAHNGHTSLAERLFFVGVVFFTLFLWRARTALEDTAMSKGQLVLMDLAYSTIFVLAAMFTYHYSQDMTRVIVTLVAGVVFFIGFYISHVKSTA